MLWLVVCRIHRICDVDDCLRHGSRFVSVGVELKCAGNSEKKDSCACRKLAADLLFEVNENGDCFGLYVSSL